METHPDQSLFFRDRTSRKQIDAAFDKMLAESRARHEARQARLAKVREAEQKASWLIRVQDPLI